MMAALFLLYGIDYLLLFFGYRKTALVFGFVSLLLCVAMLKYHATDTLQIRW